MSAETLRIHLGADAITVAAAGQTASAPVETLVRQPAWREQRPDDWWDALTTAIEDLRTLADLSAVTNVELTRDLRGWVLLDGEREPIRPAIIDGDVRLVPGSPLPWLRQHEPIAYKRIQHILTPKAWLRYRLTSELVADMEDAADLGLFDTSSGEWRVERCDELEIRIDLLPLILPERRIDLRANAPKELGTMFLL